MEELSGWQSPEIYEAILDCLEDGVYLVDRENRIVFWNRGAERITGFQRHEVLGRSCTKQILSHSRLDGTPLCGPACPLMRTLHDGQTRNLDLFLRHRDGHCIPVRTRTAAIHTASGEWIGVAEVFARNSEAADHQGGRTCGVSAPGCLDALTGAADRAYASTYLAQQISEFEAYGLPLSVLRVDIDGLREVNHSRGREAGNAVLRLLARTLAESLAHDDLLARLDKDEFLVILTSCSGEALLDLAERTRLVVSLSAISWWGDQLSVTVSIGGATARRGDTVDTLLARAGDSLAVSKSSGGNRVTLPEEA
ncbi:MAG: sensor domain-containing diguanylate cyclase [Acidobacteriales bacterium]|nr:sensor domain-containing diguanylate cyclase [Terriglobales bacterium]